MEKISGIVKGSSRVSGVDLKNSAPVRPGAPTFGRAVGQSTAIEKDMGSTAERAVAKHKEMQAERRAAAEGAQIARHMADKFFVSQSKPAPEIIDMDLNERVLQTITESPQKPLNQEQQTATEDGDWVPPGSYLDLNV